MATVAAAAGCDRGREQELERVLRREAVALLSARPVQPYRWLAERCAAAGHAACVAYLAYASLGSAHTYCKGGGSKLR